MKYIYLKKLTLSRRIIVIIVSKVLNYYFFISVVKLNILKLNVFFSFYKNKLAMKQIKTKKLKI